MGHIRKKEPVPHFVVVDTNILWHKDKKHAVNPDFDSFWDRHVKEFKLQLLLPEVVRGELLFQQCTSAEKCMKRASTALEEASEIIDSKYRHRLTPTRIRQRVQGKLDRWVAARGAKVVDTPINNIDWKAMVENSVWRQPPFDNDPKNRDNEKGFRDALILETLAHEFQTRQAKVKLVFLCDDELLLSAADERMSSDSRYDSYESLADFESYLKLTQQLFEADFIRAILRKASRKFFVKNDFTAFYYRENIRQRLLDDFATDFGNPSESASTARGLAAPLWYSRKVAEEWKPRGSGTYWIYNSQFVRIEDGKKYCWMNPITFVQVFYRPGGLLQGLVTEEATVDHVLVLPFEVMWHATVTRDGRFREPQVEDIKLKAKTFQAASDEQARKWNLKPETGI